jgi:alpha-tubulin suppressor-like RCC1 family protein
MLRNKIKQVSCGWNFTLLLDISGNVYTTGDSVALGQGKRRLVNSFCFQKVSGNLKNIRYISSGKDHALALSSTKVYGWGNNTGGQLGIPQEKIYEEPTELLVPYSYLCYAGNECSFFATEKGVYAAGRNNNGRLGLDSGKRNKLPTIVPALPSGRVKSFSGCSRYSLI